MKLRRCYRIAVGMTCGAFLLQTGGCIDELLLPTILNLGLNFLFGLLLGTPIF
jgi:hypothetical protein